MPSKLSGPAFIPCVERGEDFLKRTVVKDEFIPEDLRQNCPEYAWTATADGENTSLGQSPQPQSLFCGCLPPALVHLGQKSDQPLPAVDLRRHGSESFLHLVLAVAYVPSLVGVELNWKAAVYH